MIIISFNYSCWNCRRCTIECSLYIVQCTSFPIVELFILYYRIVYHQWKVVFVFLARDIFRISNARSWPSLRSFLLYMQTTLLYCFLVIDRIFFQIKHFALHSSTKHTQQYGSDSDLHLSWRLFHIQIAWKIKEKMYSAFCSLVLLHLFQLCSPVFGVEYRK